ncbi:hypothetical protein T08_6954 [Trichinella sp. T8]|nr:hypothetical protein T08_8410 [Trichinella sp. T8]KRZ81513.1 hypothetical protein T08_6954 [Trichinella sp. T8]
MALPSIGPEICVASLITEVPYIVNIVDLRWFSDTSHKTSIVQVRVAICAFGESVIPIVSDIAPLGAVGKY